MNSELEYFIDVVVGGEMVEPEANLSGGSHTKVVRVGETVRRMSRNPSVSSTVFDLLRHLEHAGCAGAPRALGFDDQGREILTFIDGEVAAQRRPGHPGGGNLSVGGARMAA